jgi:hypothetical protein
MGILVETIATLISMRSRIAASRVSKPKIRARYRLFQFRRRTGPSYPTPECRSWPNGLRRGRLDKETFGFLLLEIFRRQLFELRSWQRERRSRVGGAHLDFGREFHQVVNAELPSYTRHFIDHFLCSFPDAAPFVILTAQCESTIHFERPDTIAYGRM